jgi:hypothetical protein
MDPSITPGPGMRTPSNLNFGNSHVFSPGCENSHHSPIRASAVKHPRRVERYAEHNTSDPSMFQQVTRLRITIISASAPGSLTRLSLRSPRFCHACHLQKRSPSASVLRARLSTYKYPRGISTEFPGGSNPDRIRAGPTMTNSGGQSSANTGKTCDLALYLITGCSSPRASERRAPKASSSTLS